MVDFEQVKALIKSEIEDAEVEIMDLTGTGDHLGLTVVSDVFKGKMLLDQHRLVMDILKEKFNENLHAVKIKTMTKEKAQSL
jgi:stress-induced morphogen